VERESRLGRNIVLLSVTSLLTDISTEMVYPVIPLYLVERLGAGPSLIGLIEGVAESLASLLKAVFGRVSDNLGMRKPLAVGGYAISLVGKILLVLSYTWNGVFLARAADRFGKGLRTAPRDALIVESTTRERYGAAFGFHRAFDTLGAVVGGAVAYLFMVSSGSGDYRTLFISSMIPAALGLGVLLRVKEPRAAARRTEGVRFWPSWRGLSWRYKGFLLIVLVFALGNSSNQFLLLRARTAGFSPAGVVLLFLVYNMTYATLSYPAGRLADAFGKRKVLVLGYLMYGLIYLAFGSVSNARQFWLLFCGYGFYSAFTEGAEKAFVAEVCPTDQRGTFLGLHATLTGIGLLPASLLAGALWQAWGPDAPFRFGGGVALLAALGLFLILPRGQGTGPTGQACREPA